MNPDRLAIPSSPLRASVLTSKLLGLVAVVALAGAARTALPLGDRYPLKAAALFAASWGCRSASCGSIIPSRTFGAANQVTTLRARSSRWSPGWSASRGCRRWRGGGRRERRRDAARRRRWLARPPHADGERVRRPLRHGDRRAADPGAGGPGVASRQGRRLGLASGLLRYVFVAAGAGWRRGCARPLPPSRRRQAICVVQIAALIARHAAGDSSRRRARCWRRPRSPRSPIRSWSTPLWLWRHARVRRATRAAAPQSRCSTSRSPFRTSGRRRRSAGAASCRSSAACCSCSSSPASCGSARCRARATRVAGGRLDRARRSATTPMSRRRRSTAATSTCTGTCASCRTSRRCSPAPRRSGSSSASSQRSCWSSRSSTSRFDGRSAGVGAAAFDAQGACADLHGGVVIIVGCSRRSSSAGTSTRSRRSRRRSSRPTRGRRGSSPARSARRRRCRPARR